MSDPSVSTISKFSFVKKQTKHLHNIRTIIYTYINILSANKIKHRAKL